MKNLPLTARQFQCLKAIKSLTDATGYAPALHELKEFLGLSSLATIHQHVSNLKRKGYVLMECNRSRSIRLTRVGENLIYRTRQNRIIENSDKEAAIRVLTGMSTTELDKLIAQVFKRREQSNAGHSNSSGVDSRIAESGS